MAKKIHLKSVLAYKEDTLSRWQAQNPVLHRGEPSIVRDEKSQWLKIGDGVTPWNNLPYKTFGNGENGESDNRQYELIETITLTEEVTVIERDKEPNGNSYSFKDIFLVFTWGGATTGDYLRVAFTIGKEYLDGFRSFATQASNSSKSIARTHTDKNIRMLGISGASTNHGNISQTIDTQYGLDIVFSSAPISKLTLSRGTAFPANTKIEIYGVRT